jgi:hypothetical protein
MNYHKRGTNFLIRKVQGITHHPAQGPRAATSPGLQDYHKSLSGQHKNGHMPQTKKSTDHPGSQADTPVQNHRHQATQQVVIRTAQPRPSHVNQKPFTKQIISTA